MKTVKSFFECTDVLLFFYFFLTSNCLCLFSSITANGLLSMSHAGNNTCVNSHIAARWHVSHLPQGDQQRLRKPPIYWHFFLNCAVKWSNKVYLAPLLLQEKTFSLLAMSLNLPLPQCWSDDVCEAQTRYCQKEDHTQCMCVLLLCTKAFVVDSSVGLLNLWRPWRPTGQEQTCSATAADNKTSQTVLSSLEHCPNQLDLNSRITQLTPCRVS